MLEKFWEIQKEINKAMDTENDELESKLGDEQDEIVKAMNDAEFKELLKADIPSAYKDYIKRIRGE